MICWTSAVTTHGHDGTAAERTGQRGGQRLRDLDTRGVQTRAAVRVGGDLVDVGRGHGDSGGAGGCVVSIIVPVRGHERDAGSGHVVEVAAATEAEGGGGGGGRRRWEIHYFDDLVTLSPVDVHMYVVTNGHLMMQNHNIMSSYDISTSYKQVVWLSSPSFYQRKDNIVVIA